MLMRAVLVCVLFAMSSCAPRLDIIGIDNPEIPVSSVPQASKHKVFIATTREDSEVVGALFSDLRAEELGLASVDVSVPPTHIVGALEVPRRLPPDPRKDFAIISPTVYASENAFLSSLNKELRQRAPAERELLFFVHGYNMTTSDAILQIGQFVEDSGFQGVPMLFAWASAGNFARYVYDLNSALIARPLLIDAAEIVGRSEATGFHLFAHSMGSFLTMEAMVDVAQKGEFDRTGKLRSVSFASPDIDFDLFRSQIKEFDTSFDQFFILLSEDDYALRASRSIAGGVQRVGNADAEAISDLGVIAIDLSQIDDSRSGSHSKFTGSPEVVKLIGRGMNDAQDFGSRPPTVMNQLLGDLPIQVVTSGG